MVLYIYLTKKGGVVAIALNGWFSQDSIPYSTFCPDTIWSLLDGITRAPYIIFTLLLPWNTKLMNDLKECVFNIKYINFVINCRLKCVKKMNNPEELVVVENVHFKLWQPYMEWKIPQLQLCLLPSYLELHVGNNS